MSRTDDYLLGREEGECDRCGETLDLTALLGDACVMVNGRPLCLECYEEASDDLDEDEETSEDWTDDREDIDPDELSDEDF